MDIIKCLRGASRQDSRPAVEATEHEIFLSVLFEKMLLEYFVWLSC